MPVGSRTASTKYPYCGIFYGILLIAYFALIQTVWFPTPLSSISPSNEKHPLLVSVCESSVQQLFQNKPDHPTALEKEISAADAPPFDFFDPISCSDASTSFAGSKWLRESGLSSTSGSSNRYRQLSTGILMAAERILSKPRIRCISEVAQSRLAVYSAEAKSSIHKVFQKHSTNYIASEYFAQDGLKGGDLVDGVRHEDLQETSFQDGSFDIVTSTEVFEHIPFPYRAHREVYRILRSGGAHVFTVPFVPDSENDIHMSSLDEETGKISHGPGAPPHFKAPMYHGDYIRPEGVLVFNLFGQEMIRNLCEIGFRVETWNMYVPEFGVVGAGSLVFVAWKD